MMRKCALPLAAVLLLAGCFSTPAKRYIQIAVVTDAYAQPHPRVEKALYIEPVRVDPLYDDFRVIYRVSQYELRYYSYVFWAKKPDSLFREAMGGYLLKRGGFPRVTLDVVLGEPEIALRSNVRLVEEVDNPKVWSGRLAMDLEFLEFKSGRTLARHSFDRSVPLEARKVRHLPAVISTVLAQELDVAVQKLAAAMDAKEAARADDHR
jgi:ABC-type uncharacterized transport system auxiliary subunit